VRSRNGNLPFLLTSLALSCTIAFGADNYYIGYRLSAKNTQAIHENLTVSKAMRPCLPENTASVIIFKCAPQESLESVLKREQTAFLEFAASDELRVKSNDFFASAQIQTLNSLTLPTKCYAVEFNDESVTITATK